jgi:hypothetical protein
MPHFQAAILPPALRQAGLFAQLGRVAKEDLARDGEDTLVAEAFEERREEVRRYLHVAVQQHHDVVLRSAESGVRAATEPEIPV